MHSMITYIIHYFVARSLFEIINPQGSMLYIIVAIGAIYLIYKYIKGKKA